MSSMNSVSHREWNGGAKALKRQKRGSQKVRALSGPVLPRFFFSLWLPAMVWRPQQIFHQGFQRLCDVRLLSFHGDQFSEGQRELLVLNSHNGNHIVVINLGDGEAAQDQCNFLPSSWGEEGGKESLGMLNVHPTSAGH